MKTESEAVNRQQKTAALRRRVAGCGDIYQFYLLKEVEVEGSREKV